MLFYFLFIPQAQFKHLLQNKTKQKKSHRQRQSQGHLRTKSSWDEKQTTEKPAEPPF